MAKGERWYWVHCSDGAADFHRQLTVQLEAMRPQRITTKNSDYSVSNTLFRKDLIRGTG